MVVIQMKNKTNNIIEHKAIDIQEQRGDFFILKIFALVQVPIFEIFYAYHYLRS